MSAIGSGKTPIYVGANGDAKASAETIGSNTKPLKMVSGELQEVEKELATKEELTVTNYGTGTKIATVMGTDILQNDGDLPIATTSTLGGVIVGNNLSITDTGILSATNATITREFFETIIREVLNDYQHFPYVNTEAAATTYTSIVPTTAGAEMTLMCDSILYINAKASGELSAYSQTEVPYTGVADTWTLAVFNNLTSSFVDVYTTDIRGFWDRYTTYQASTEGTITYKRPLTGSTTDCKMFYLQAGARIKLTLTNNKADISGVCKIIPIKKKNAITTTKFITDCTITLDPSSYSMNYDNYSSVALTPTVTVVDPDGNTLVQGTDYTVNYVDNVMKKQIVGITTGSDLNPYLQWSHTNQGQVVITGIGNWGSSVTKTFDKKFTDNQSRVLFAKYVSGGDPGSVKSYSMIFLDETVASITWESGDRSGYTDAVYAGSSVGNTYTSTGKKYYKKTSTDGTVTRTYLEL